MDLKSLLAQVSPPVIEGPLELSFKEARSYPFRKYPKDFSGTIQWTPEGTVTVAYSFPSAYEIILNSEGARLVQDDGSERDLGDPAGLALLRDLVQWDTEAIAQQWSLVSTEVVDGQTQIVLQPKTSTMADRIKSLSVTCGSRGVTAVRVEQKDSIRRDYTFATVEPATELR